MFFAVARGKWIVSVPVADERRAKHTLDTLRNLRPDVAYRLIRVTVVR